MKTIKTIKAMKTIKTIKSFGRFYRAPLEAGRFTGFIERSDSAHPGFSLLETVLYLVFFIMVSLVVVQLLLNIQNAFAQARIHRTVHQQGASALERMVREIRLALRRDPSASIMNTNPGTLLINTVTSPTDATPITRKFFIASGSLMLQEGASPALPLTTADVQVTNLVFRDSGRLQASNRFYYVRGSYAGCANSNDGLSPQSAFCTISKAASLATAGSAVVVGAGVYAESVVLTNSGTVSQPITYLADVSGAMTGDAGDVVISGGTYGFQFVSSGANTGIDYTTIEGFTITGTTYGIWAGQGSDYDVVRNNKITGTTDGFFLTSTWGNSTYAHPVGWLIEFNDIFNNTNGMNFSGGEFTDAVVQYNKIHANSIGIYAHTAGTSNSGFESANNVTLRHNEIYSNTNQGVLGHMWFDGLFFDNHIYSNGAEGFWVAYRSSTVPQVMNFRNNSIHDNGADGLLFGNESNRGALNSSSVIENNIITQNGESGIDTTLNQCAIIQNNDVWGNANSYNGCSNPPGPGNISLNPLYMSSPVDVHLSAVVAGQAANSPAIDGGYQQASAIGLDIRWTRTDAVTDSGTVDMGYHYGSEAPGVQPFFAGSPVSQVIRIELTVSGGTGRFQTSESLSASAVLRGSYR